MPAAIMSIVDRQGQQVERRDVQIGDSVDSGVTIISGLSGNERVVETAGPFLNAGQLVRQSRPDRRTTLRPDAGEVR